MEDPAAPGLRTRTARPAAVDCGAPLPFGAFAAFLSARVLGGCPIGQWYSPHQFLRGRGFVLRDTTLGGEGSNSSVSGGTVTMS